jgi:uncharacterized BrkB/YihY/UPF0761 family membrane protein
MLLSASITLILLAGFGSILTMLSMGVAAFVAAIQAAHGRQPCAGVIKSLWVTTQTLWIIGMIATAGLYLAIK